MAAIVVLFSVIKRDENLRQLAASQHVWLHMVKCALEIRHGGLPRTRMGRSLGSFGLKGFGIHEIPWKWINQSMLLPCPYYLCFCALRHVHAFLITSKQLAQVICIIRLVAGSGQLKRCEGWATLWGKCINYANYTNVAGKSKNERRLITCH